MEIGGSKRGQGDDEKAEGEILTGLGLSTWRESRVTLATAIYAFQSLQWAITMYLQFAV